MNQTVLSQDEILSRIRLAVESRGITQKYLAEATGVHQSQISRILAGKSVRVSKNLAKISRYIDEMHICISKDRDFPPVLLSAIRSTWDGSIEHAEAIARVIASVRGLTVVKR